MDGVRLVRPTADLEAPYRRMIADWGDEARVPYTLNYACEPFRVLLERLEHERTTSDLPEGFVNHSTFWLVDAAGEIVAESNLRHELTDRLRRMGGHIGYGVAPSARRRGHATEVLRRTLPHARDLGIDRALVTCARDNVASARTIQRNGGELFEEEHLEPEGYVLQRYWIPLRTS